MVVLTALESYRRVTGMDWNLLYRLGIGSVGPVLSGPIELLMHRMRHSSHAENFEVAYILDVEIC